jgi:hypothetical protein
MTSLPKWATAFAFLFVASSASGGQALDAAQAQRSKAFNDFFTQYMNSAQQPADAQAISAQTIAPADAATVNALNQEKLQAFKASGIQVLTQEQATALHEKAKAQLEQEAAERGETEGDGAGSGDGKEDTADAKAKGDSKTADTGRGTVTAARKPASPETVLDGSKIPKQIIFGGGSSNTPPANK